MPLRSQLLYTVGRWGWGLLGHSLSRVEERKIKKKVNKKIRTAQAKTRLTRNGK